MNSPKKNKSRSSRNYFPKLVHAVIWFCFCFFISLLLLFATGVCVLANKRYRGLVMCSTIPHWLGLHLTHFPLWRGYHFQIRATKTQFLLKWIETKFFSVWKIHGKGKVKWETHVTRTVRIPLLWKRQRRLVVDHPVNREIRLVIFFQKKKEGGKKEIEKNLHLSPPSSSPPLQVEIHVQLYTFDKKTRQNPMCVCERV